MAKQKVGAGVYRHAASDPDLGFELALLFHGLLAAMLAKRIMVFAGFL